MSEPIRYILVEISGIQWMHVKENRMTAAYPGEFVRWDDYARLKAEVERLRNLGIKLDGYVDLLQAENKRLRKAGDAVALDYAERIEIEAGETVKTLMKTLPVLREWNAANREQGCLVNPIKVAQYLPNPPAKEGKQP